ncbi:MAG: P-loop containing nucleoside triphosphate hydrolase protein [Monoraphidium minutum]|nr:MAG: P-loop containing nucleoside triphosphate hydrolase protein [Monoraphidium minutum]
MKLPGLLVIDTPGHESFTNLRARGSGLCDVAVLIVDLMHGLEQQTIESINLLKMRKTPFIVALNKVDRLYGWKSTADIAIRDSFKRQKDDTMREFEDRSSQVFLQLNEQGLNVSLYWKNPDPRKYVNVVPTSAITGEGISDLLQLMVKLTQSMMVERLTLLDETQCTVLEVKTLEGLGTTIDVVLINGTLKEGDRIVACGLQGPIVTRIKALKTPQVLKEMRVKGMLMDHKEIKAAMGAKIVAPGLEHAVAGTALFVVGPEDDEEELKDTVMEDMADIFDKVDKSGEGVCVQASTLGSLEALLAFLDSDDVKIPVSGINIGPVHKKDVLRANVMGEKGCKKFSVILAFDVPVATQAKELAAELGVRIFTADIIYHLFDQFTAYMKEIKAQEQERARFDAVFPCVLQIMPTCIFNMRDPLVLGVEVVEGIAKVGTPVTVPTKGGLDLGRIASMELNHKAVDTVRAGNSVAMKIEGTNATEQSRTYGRHFDHKDQIVSRISRESINALKSHFADDMTKEDWRLIIKLKKVFQVN